MPYPDVSPDAWYAEAVDSVTAAGLMEGYDDGKFHPAESLKRCELAVVLDRLLKKVRVYYGE